MPTLPKLLLLSTSLLLVFYNQSCKQSIASDEQISKYQKYQKLILENHQLLDTVLDLKNQSDSVKLLFDDIKSLSLNEFIQKHHFSKRDIDPFLVSLKTTSEIINAFNKLEKALSIGKLDIDALQNKIDTNNLNFNKIEPLELSSSKYLLTGDSMTLKAVIAAYDSSKSNEDFQNRLRKIKEDREKKH